MVPRLDVSVKFINIFLISFFKNLLILNLIYFSYYNMPVNKVQKLINAIDNNKTGFTTTPFISKKNLMLEYF